MNAHEVLTQFARLVSPGVPPDGSPTPQSLCQASVTIAGASGGAVVVDYSEDTRMILFATDGVAHRIEDLQEVLGEGPGWESFRTSEATSADLSTTWRWPVFSATAAQEFGPVSVAAAPIHAGGEAVGVLSLYWAEPQTSQGPDLLDLLGLLGNLVGAFFATASDEEWETNLPWPYRASIHQAVGLLVAQLRLTVENAAAVLRAYAFSSGLDLHGAAVSVLQQRITLQLPQHRQGPS